MPNVENVIPLPPLPPLAVSVPSMFTVPEQYMISGEVLVARTVTPGAMKNVVKLYVPPARIVLVVAVKGPSEPLPQFMHCALEIFERETKMITKKVAQVMFSFFIEGCLKV